MGFASIDRERAFSNFNRALSKCESNEHVQQTAKLLLEKLNLADLDSNSTLD